MYEYYSEHTRFMRELMKRKPELVEEQQKGRAIWWDKPINQSEQNGFQEASVPQQGYVYQNKR
jgi:hypothetical protein